ncbi:MAG: nucleotidyltransferase domain-containing protein [Candidatus Woesearchaeota archaeon]
MDLNMGQLQIARQFFENPTKSFQIRGLAKTLRIPKTTVSYQLRHLLLQGIIIKEKKGVFPSYRANDTAEAYRFCKRQDFLKRLMESKLLDYLEQKATQKCIFLFGSFAKAEYSKESDIDLFVQARDTQLDLRQYERLLGHKINILFEPEVRKLSTELLNNIVNGTKLQGFLKLR